MRRWAMVLVLLFGAGLAGGDMIHGTASAGGSGTSQSGQFVLGPTLKF